MDSTAMADLDSQTLAKIKQYAEEGRNREDQQMDADPVEVEEQLDHTLKELQNRVQQQQAALEKV